MQKAKTQVLRHPQPELEALLKQGFTLHNQGQLAQAQVIYEQLLARQPKHFDALHLMGVLAHQRKDYAMAVAWIGKALEINPNDAAAFNNHGNALKNLNRFREAVASYDRAIAIQPDFAAAHSNLGTALRELNQLAEAVASYDRAIAIKPEYAEAWHNRGNALQELRQLDEAMASYDRAIAIKPDYANAQWNKALSLLLQGNFRQGWDLYEWGRKNGQRGAERNFKKPLWMGVGDVANKTILLCAEQGLGDTIQFCRYAKIVKALGARVVLEVPKMLVGLLSRLEGVDVVVQAGQALPEFDYHCSLLSLPLVFGTGLSSIPSANGYLTVENEKVGYWKGRLATRSRLKIGVVWNGGYRPDQPEIWTTNERRNIPLDVFARGLNFLNADFFSLQKGDPAESEIRNRELEYWPGDNFFNYANELIDFTDTAALIANLDLVVSVDTSTAHLAAAMGKPTWILNRFDTCWRWMLDRDDSPWYESVKLYRQDQSRKWEPVFERLAKDVHELAA